MTKRQNIKITFTEKEKRVDMTMIASAIAKKMREGENKDAKRKEIS